MQMIASNHSQTLMYITFLLLADPDKRQAATHETYPRPVSISD